MRFDMFQEFLLRQGASHASAFAESFQQIALAEEMGFQTVWLAELHFSPRRSVLASPIPIASAIVARHQRLRVGLAVQLIALNNPVRIAEEVATVDHIAEGRFDFGIGSSRLAHPFDGYGIPFEEARGRFDECLEILLKAWTNEEFSHEGQYYTFRNVQVIPKPYQKPHPPLRLAVTTVDGYVRAGHMGLPVFIGIRDITISQAADLLGSYDRAWKEAGHSGKPDSVLRIPVYCAETMEKAHSDPEDSVMAWVRSRSAAFGEEATQAGRAEGAEVDASRADQMSESVYDRVLREHVAFGTPEALVERFQELAEVLGVSALILETNPGGQVPPDKVLSSMHLLGERVFPQFGQATPRG